MLISSELDDPEKKPIKKELNHRLQFGRRRNKWGRNEERLVYLSLTRVEAALELAIRAIAS